MPCKREFPEGKGVVDGNEIPYHAAAAKKKENFGIRKKIFNFWNTSATPLTTRHSDNPPA